MSFQKEYNNYKEKILNDQLICKENRDLFKKFFNYEEYKLKRTNGLDKLDESCFNTLYNYVKKLKNVNNWFKNKPWINLTKEDIKKVYDALEEGKIKNIHGKKFTNLSDSYYSKIFKSKPFELAGKKEIVKEVMEFHRNKHNEEVRYIEEATFRKLVNVAIKPEHRLLLWLAFDIGENISTLIKLKKGDFFREINEENKEVEYRVNLPKDKLKRSRQTRSEITNFRETTELLDIVLEKLKNDDPIVKFEYRMAKKFLDRTVRITKAKCIPKGQKVTWKDLRSSMACYLLNKGWTSDEINARLGHKPSSKILDRYVNFLAIDRHKPKQKLIDSDVKKVKVELDEIKEREKLYLTRLETQNEKIKGFEEVLKDLTDKIVDSNSISQGDKLFYYKQRLGHEPHISDGKFVWIKNKK